MSCCFVTMSVVAVSYRHVVITAYKSVCAVMVSLGVVGVSIYIVEDVYVCVSIMTVIF